MSDHVFSAKQEPTTPRVVHIIPQYGVGGVEKAAYSSAVSKPENIHLLFLSSSEASADLRNGMRNVEEASSRHALSLRAALFAVTRVSQIDPDIIIFSLWKSVLAFLLLRLLVRRPRFILFLHIDRPMHVLDRFSTWLMHGLADEIWSDSNMTATRRIGFRRCSKSRRVISFIVERVRGTVRNEPAPRFVYWGRLTAQKRIDQALLLISELTSRGMDPEFVIIGPDRGSQAELESLAGELNIQQCVHFTGPKSTEDIRRLSADATFYLQFSDCEGMAMSVVEAMQLGLVPVVTPVGEIANYCRDGENAFIHTDIGDTATRIAEVLREPKTCRRMSRAAIAQWMDAPLYKDDIVQAAYGVATEMRPAAPA